MQYLAIESPTFTNDYLLIHWIAQSYLTEIQSYNIAEGLWIRRPHTDTSSAPAVVVVL